MPYSGPDDEFSRPTAARYQMPGWIYVFEDAERGIVKIGWSTDPLKRIGGVQAASGAVLTLGPVMAGTMADEQEIHHILRESRRHPGEWFDRTAKVEAMLDAMMGTHISRQPPRSVEAIA